MHSLFSSAILHLFWFEHYLVIIFNNSLFVFPYHNVTGVIQIKFWGLKHHEHVQFYIKAMQVAWSKYDFIPTALKYALI